MNMVTTEADSSYYLLQKYQIGMNSVAVAKLVLSGPLLRYVKFSLHAVSRLFSKKNVFVNIFQPLFSIGSVPMSPLPSILGIKFVAPRSMDIPEMPSSPIAHMHVSPLVVRSERSSNS